MSLQDSISLVYTRYKKKDLIKYISHWKSRTQLCDNYGPLKTLVKF